MRKVLVGVLLALCLAISIGAGVIAAEWPFWKRILTLPTDAGEWPESYYQPVEAIDGGGSSFFPIATPEELTIEPAALEQAARWAEEHNSVALLVLHRGKLQLERYWQGMRSDELFSGRAMSRSLVGFAYGFALAEGFIASLDEPASVYLDEWREDPRGAITLRQLLQNVSGLEEVPLAGPDRGGFFARLPALLGKNSRLSLGSDFAATALSFELEHDPGTRFAFSNANSQLLGVILERASGQPFERFVEERLWRPLGAGRAEFYMDRANGMPAVYCCFRSSPRDWLRLGALLIDERAASGRQVLPVGWTRELARTSEVNPLYGLQLWFGRAPAGVREYVPGSGQGVTHGEPYLAEDVFWMEGGGGRTIWAVPSAELVIVRLGRASPGWDASMLPNLLLPAQRAPAALSREQRPPEAAAGGD